MKTQRNILIAFLLNLAFSIFEFFGGVITGSVAIMSDAVHDLGDAVSIGISYVLERLSKKKPDEVYTYGYARYSVVGSVITTIILLLGSIMVIFGAVKRLFMPGAINYDGMIIFAVIGVMVNFAAAWFTKDGDSLNQKAVNLHMLEDVLGWIVVLIGAIVMRFTDIRVIDPLLCIGVAVFILIQALKNLSQVLDIFLEKMPKGISIQEIKEHVLEIDGVEDVHHIHIRSMNGQDRYATMHIVTAADSFTIKNLVRQELAEHGICHATLELEQPGEHCFEEECPVVNVIQQHHHHHHHHHH